MLDFGLCFILFSINLSGKNRFKILWDMQNSIFGRFFLQNQSSLNLFFHYLTIGGSWKGPIKQGLLILLSACLSVQAFSWKWMIVFSKFWHSVRNPYEVVCNRAGFLAKKYLPPPESLKWAKNRIFWIYWKICSLV